MYSLAALCLLSTSLVVCDSCFQGWHRYKGFCYGFGDTALSWSEAQVYCRLYNGNLVEIEDADENAFLKNITSQKLATDAWIGGTDIFSEGNWEWSYSKSPIQSFTDWARGEPNNAREIDTPGEDCLMLHQWDNYQWNDNYCSKEASFVCETPETSAIVG